jgi:hypothetical protein
MSRLPFAGAATPTFSSNGSNASQNTTATFYQPGIYTFQVTITDPSGLSTVSSVRTSPGSAGLTVAAGYAAIPRSRQNKQAHGPHGPWACVTKPQAACYFSLTTSSTGFAVARFAGV